MPCKVCTHEYENRHPFILSLCLTSLPAWPFFKRTTEISPGLGHGSARRHKSQLAGNKRNLPFMAPGLVLGLLLPRSCEKFGQMLDSGEGCLTSCSRDPSHFLGSWGTLLPALLLPGGRGSSEIPVLVKHDALETECGVPQCLLLPKIRSADLPEQEPCLWVL